MSNAGPEIAEGVSLDFSYEWDILPAIEAIVSQGSVGQDGGYFIHFGTLPVGATATFTLKVLTTEPGIFDDDTEAESNQHDPAPANNDISDSVTVTESPGIFEFREAMFTVRENESAATIYVSRRGGALGPVSVDFASSNLTAAAGADFAAANGTLFFVAGETSKVFTVTVSEDTVAECNETLLLLLSNPAGGAILGARTNALLMIVDNDSTFSGALEAVSLDTNTPPRVGDSDSYVESITADGTFVTFFSYAETLVTNDFNDRGDVFLRNTTNHTTKLINVNTNGASGSGFSGSSSVSANGRWVAFESDASDLVAGDNNSRSDIFLRDMVMGTTRLVTANNTGTGPGNADSWPHRITPDGRFILFESFANNLVTNDFNGLALDIFLYDVSNNVVELVSVNDAGTASGNGYSEYPVVSDDGRYVAFESDATNLHPLGTNGNRHVYVRDRVLGTNILCSVATNHTSGGNDWSDGAVINANGSAVIFASDARNLAPGDANDGTDLFVYDIASGQVQLVSVNLAGTGSGNNDSWHGVVSADGRYVAFHSDASDLVVNDHNGETRDVFVRDRTAGTTMLVSVNCSGDGSGNGESYWPRISADGRFVAFESYATDVTAGDFVPDEQNVFRRDLLTGSTLLISFNHGLTGGGDGYSGSAILSADGSAVAFESQASTLLASDDNDASDVFLWRAPAAGPVGTNAAIASLQMAGGKPTLSVSGSPGTLYLLQRATSLTPPISWIPFGTTNAPPSGQFEFIDPAPWPGSAFYRVARP